jgi:hypothetical protein
MLRSGFYDGALQDFISVEKTKKNSGLGGINEGRSNGQGDSDYFDVSGGAGNIRYDS